MKMKIEILIAKHGIDKLPELGAGELREALQEYRHQYVDFDYNGIGYAAIALQKHRTIFTSIVKKCFTTSGEKFDYPYDPLPYHPSETKTPSLYLIAIFQANEALTFLCNNVKFSNDHVRRFFIFQNEGGAYAIHILINKHPNTFLGFLEHLFKGKRYDVNYEPCIDLIDKDKHHTLHLIAQISDASLLTRCIEGIIQKFGTLYLEIYLTHQNIAGQTPLHILCARPELTEFNAKLITGLTAYRKQELLRKSDKFNGTVLHVSAIKQSARVTKLLIDAITENDESIYTQSLAPDSDQRTILHLIAVFQPEQLLFDLIEKMPKETLRQVWSQPVEKNDGFMSNLFYLILKHKGLACLKAVLTKLLKKLDAIAIEEPLRIQSVNARSRHQKIDQLENRKCATSQANQNIANTIALAGIINTVRTKGIDNLYVINTKTGDTLAHIAVQSNSVALLLELLNQNADFNQANNNRITPWKMALSQPRINLNILIILLIGNADSRATNIHGDALSDIAIDNNWPFETIGILIRSGLDLRLIVDKTFQKILNKSCGAEVSEKGVVLLPMNPQQEKIDSRLVLLLLSCGANVNLQNAKKDTILHIAIRDGWNEKDIMEILLYKPDLSIANNNSETALKLLMSLKMQQNTLSFSSLFGSEDNALPFSKNLAVAFIEKGADANTKNAQGQTIVHLAVLSKDHELLAKLTTLSASFVERDNNQKTPWEYITPVTSIEIILALLRAGAAPAHKRIVHNGLTLMHQIALDIKLPALNFATYLDLVIKTGINIEDTNSHGESALAMLLNKGYAAEKYPHFRLEFAIKLIEAGADPNTKDKKGNTLFHLLAMYDKEQYNQLINKFPKADLTISNNDQLSPIQLLVLSPISFNATSASRMNRVRSRQ